MSDKVNIILEQVVMELEQIKSSLDENKSKEGIEMLAKELKGLNGIEEYQVLINNNLNKMSLAHDSLTQTINSYVPVNKTIVQHVFFPGILEWLNAIKKGSTVWLLLSLLAISCVFNFQWFNEKEKYHDAYYKFKSSLYFNLEPGFVDTAYYNHKSHVLNTIDSIDDVIDHQQQIQTELQQMNGRSEELRKQLNSTQ